MTEINKLVVSRKRWLRGEGSDKSMLLRPLDDKMCCLGFLACQVGAREEDIRDKTEPESPFSSGWEWPSWMFDSSKPLVGLRYRLMTINDDASLSEEQRESILKEEFAKVGVEVEFIP